jgi:hypothetical protein
MTILQFRRSTRRQLEEQIVALEHQRDRALGKERATRDRVASWLEQRAGCYREDARHLERLKSRPDPDAFTAQQRRAIAAELSQCAVDFEEGR